MMDNVAILDYVWRIKNRRAPFFFEIIKRNHAQVHRLGHIVVRGK